MSPLSFLFTALLGAKRSRRHAVGLLLPALMVTGGCYHMTVETGAPPSTRVVSDKSVSAWFVGLVPPNTVVTVRRCPLGVAKVETGLSVSNALVSVVTLGIYTPMTVRATCTQGAPPVSYPPVMSGSRILRAASLEGTGIAP